MTIAMFSLIIFSLVMIATISAEPHRRLPQRRRAREAGISRRTPMPASQSPTSEPRSPRRSTIRQISGDRQAARRPAGLYARCRKLGRPTGPPGSYPVYEMDPTFVDDHHVEIPVPAPRATTPTRQLSRRLKSEPNVVVDRLDPGLGNDFGPPATFDLPGFKRDGSSFEPVQVDDRRMPMDPDTTTVKVIGVIGQLVRASCRACIGYATGTRSGHRPERRPRPTTSIRPTAPTPSRWPGDRGRGDQEWRPGHVDPEVLEDAAADQPAASST